MLEEVWVVEHVLRMYEALNLIPRTAGIPKHSVHSPSGFQELPAQAWASNPLPLEMTLHTHTDTHIERERKQVLFYLQIYWFPISNLS